MRRVVSVAKFHEILGLKYFMTYFKKKFTTFLKQVRQLSTSSK